MSCETLAMLTAAGSMDYYDAAVTANKCCLSEKLHIFESYIEQAVCNANNYPSVMTAEGTDKKSWQTIEEAVQTFLSILPTVLNFTLGQLYFQRLQSNKNRRFVMEFLLVLLPIPLTLTICNPYNGYYILALSSLLTFHLWRTRFWKTAPTNTYELDKRPMVYTLLRSTIYAGVGVGILAVDFPQFPKEYRKNRAFGASVMDLGIGIFVFIMGLVSHRTTRLRDLSKILKVTIILLVLGLGRTLSLMLIDYHQDVHEYGKHLNAFFILGLTKFFGSLCSFLAKSDKQLLPLSLGILCVHELMQQVGVSQFVLSDDVKRNNFLTANREGFSSLPGSISLYLFSIYYSKWYIAKAQLSFVEILTKLQKMFLAALGGWTLTFIGAFVIGILRVTFNMPYVIWVITMAHTFLLLYMFFFEIALLSPTPMAPQELPVIGDEIVGQKSSVGVTHLPVTVEALNRNCLVHFLISNLLTGFVNMTLQPDERNGFETVVILMLFMLASNGFVYLLHRKNIRIA